MPQVQFSERVTRPRDEGDNRESQLTSRSPPHDDLRTPPFAPQILSCSPERPPLKLVHVVHTQDGSLKSGIHGDGGCVASTSTYSDQATGGGAYYYHGEEGGPEVWGEE